jgi:hypothetical protein
MNFYNFIKNIKMFVKKFKCFSYKDDYNKRNVLINKNTFNSLLNTHYYNDSQKTFYKKDKIESWYDSETEVEKNFQGKRKISINECIESLIKLKIQTKRKYQD